MVQFGSDYYTASLPANLIAAMEGRVYCASTGKISQALAGTTRITLKNKSDSRKVLISAIATVNDAAIPGVGFGTVIKDPTGNLPTSIKEIRPAIIGGTQDPSVCELKADANILSASMTGGEVLGSIGVPSGRALFDQTFVILAPGTMIGFNIPYAGATNAECSFYLIELPDKPNS